MRALIIEKRVQNLTRLTTCSSYNAIGCIIATVRQWLFVIATARPCAMMHTVVRTGYYVHSKRTMSKLRIRIRIQIL